MVFGRRMIWDAETEIDKSRKKLLNLLLSMKITEFVSENDLLQNQNHPNNMVSGCERKKAAEITSNADLYQCFYYFWLNFSEFAVWNCGMKFKNGFHIALLPHLYMVQWLIH